MMGQNHRCGARLHPHCRMTWPSSRHRHGPRQDPVSIDPRRPDQPVRTRNL